MSGTYGEGEYGGGLYGDLNSSSGQTPGTNTYGSGRYGGGTYGALGSGQPGTVDPPAGPPGENYVRRPATIITFGDSITAFTMHRGENVAQVIFQADTSSLLGGAIPQEWANTQMQVSLFDCNSGYTSTGDPDEPFVFPGVPFQGREGFSSDTGMGLFVDALVNEGITTDLINFWEYACGGTTATACLSSPGAWGAGMPEFVDHLGGDYGCPPGQIDGGFVYNNRETIWLSKQAWLEGTGDPYEHYTFCDAIAHCPTERCIVIGSIGGNDFIDLGKTYKFADPFTGEFDPDGGYAARALEIYYAVQAFVDKVHMLNANAEVYIVGYPNFVADAFGAGNDLLNFRWPYRGAETDILWPLGLGPKYTNHWPVYSGDGAPTLDPLSDGIYYESWDTLQNRLCTWPLGTVFTLPGIWNPQVSKGFARGYFAGMGFTAQKDAEYLFLQDWVGRQFANLYAWQMQGTAANPGFFVPTHSDGVHIDPGYPGYWVNSVGPGATYQHTHWYWSAFFGWFQNTLVDGQGPTYNWRVRNLDGSGNPLAPYWSLRGALAQGHGWDQIFARTRELLEYSQLNNTVLLSNGSVINFPQAWTVLTKFFTTKFLSMMFRDQLRPIFDDLASTRQWLHHLDVWDDVDLADRSPINSQDDPNGVPVYPGDHYIEGLHLTSKGGPKWCRKVAQHLLAVTQAWKWERINIVVVEPPEWKFVIGAGNAEAYEIKALDRKFRFELKAPSNVSFTANLLDPSSAYILPLQTDLKCYRGTDKVFRGRIGPMTASLDANSGYASFSAVDYRGVLDRRLVYEDDNAFWYGEDVSTIVWDMITFIQSRTGGSYALQQGTGFPLGVTRGEVEFQPGDSVMASLQKIADNKVRGFDWEIDPDMNVNVWAARGNTTPKNFDYKGAAISVDWDYDTAQFANAARATGSGDTFAEELETADVGTDPRGRWESQLAWPDVETQEIMEDRTQYLLEQANIVPESFTLNLRQGHWQGPYDLWLGDVVVVTLRFGALDIQKTTRIHSLEVTLDESGGEQVSLVVK